MTSTSCPDVNVATQGDSLNEAIANLREAVELALEGEDPATYDLLRTPPFWSPSSWGD
jgi:hypothetical protein